MSAEKQTEPGSQDAGASGLSGGCLGLQGLANLKQGNICVDFC